MNNREQLLKVDLSQWFAAFVTLWFLGYKKVTSRFCKRPITSVAECEEAARQLELTDTTVKEGTKSNSPPYCYMYFRESKGQLKFNNKSDSTKQCTVEYNCICKIDYKKVTSGNCERPITSKEECAEAARQLELKDTYATEPNNAHHWPPYCYFKPAGWLYFNNKVDSDTPCGRHNTTCICK